MTEEGEASQRVAMPTVVFGHILHVCLEGQCLREVGRELQLDRQFDDRQEAAELPSRGRRGQV